MTFEQLDIIEPIQKALKAEGYVQPTPIQEQSIPILLQNKDLLGCAQTGTGKTAAFAIPILQQLYKNPVKGRRTGEIAALIVTPTRELAIQIAESFDAYGKYTSIKNTVIFGGVKQGAQTTALKRGVDVLIATPGRLLDLISQGFISLGKLQYFVLDEADRMLDMGFIHDVKKIIAKLPAKRQSLFFSATMAPPIVELSRKILGNPEKVTIQPEQTTAEKVQQAIYFVNKKNKIQLLNHLLENGIDDSVLVFSRTKHGANKIVKKLEQSGVKSSAIHGNKSQNARQQALNDFKLGKLKVLVATDIAARGIDIDELSFVVNYDLPNVPETYVHRIGRTGRAGASGLAVSFCDAEEKAYLLDIQKLIGQKIPVVKEHPFPLSAEEVEAEAANQQVKPEKNNSNQQQRTGKKKGNYFAKKKQKNWRNN